ncbi:MAG: flagellar brake protein [Gammaproteobacteria bacterium]|nr:flagellar brake protein [Gammaproteobacteria bacterium]
MSDVENLIDAPENEEFLIHSRSSIASILRNLMRENRTISAYLPSSDDMVATSVLHVDADKNMVIVERARETKLNHLFEDGHNILFDLKHNNVILQFVAKRTQPARFNGQSAVFLELPKVLLRLQRREYFRVAADTGNQNITCTLKETDGSELKLEVEDLSLGGIGTTLELGESPTIKQFKTFRNCLLQIPGFGTLQIDLQVRNCFEKTLSSGKRVVRLGLSYVDLPADKEAMLQKYINKVQLEQLRQQEDA